MKTLVQRQPEEKRTLQRKISWPVQRIEERNEDELLQGKFTVNKTPIQLQNNSGEAENSYGMPYSLRRGMEKLSGLDLSDVTVYTNSTKPALINALAYTQGQNIYLGPGQEKHLPHEGWHAVQQMQGRVQPSIQEKKMLINDDASLEQEADVMGEKALQAPLELHDTISYHSNGLRDKHRGQITSVIQMKPSYLETRNFIGFNVEVNPVMSTRLQNVETHLQSEYNAIPPTAQDRPVTLRDYAGLEDISGWRPGSSSSKHASGSAVDVNYHNQPYIATRTITRTGTRTTTVYGGEGGNSASRQLRELRKPAVEVYDRARRFMNWVNNPPVADVGASRSGETSTAIYRRFRAVSDELTAYLSLAFHTNYDVVRRQPVANIESISEANLLAAIPTTERIDENIAVPKIRLFLLAQRRDEDAQTVGGPSHPPRVSMAEARDQYIRMLRDYEHVRIPMERGKQSISPANTRNPALGFLHMNEHFVTAMIDVGHLRWGASGFGGPASGDMHHFDLDGHAGYTPDGTP
ncbi:MAG: DUF4157 domain-containing protein [Candidatus Electrothrix sp. AR4]|nr:DUF4157 domain-containing protein [Candidatus Electrothrix sp. AR4]